MALAIITSPATRDGHSSTLHRFLREYSTYLQEYEIHATGGTHEAMLRTGLLKASQLKRHSPGTKGVVEIANLAIEAQFEAVALLLDPTDPLSESPENLALERACIIKGIPQLMNLYDLAHWLNYEAKRNFADVPENERLALVASMKPSEEVVALVAHDGKKKDMLDFCAKNMIFLMLKHKELIATGTTGILLVALLQDRPYGALRDVVGPNRWEKICGDEKNREEKERLSYNWNKWLERIRGWREDGWEEVQPRDLKQPRFQNPKRGKSVKVVRFESGPKGGDIQIANRIINGECGAVLFFEDTQQAHPHGPDIRLCIRTCRLPDVNLTLRRDEISASRWANGWATGPRQGLPASKGALPERWPEQILTLPKAVHPRKEGENDPDVSQLTRACAGYLDELLHEVLTPGVRRRARRRVLILVAGGITMRSIVDHLNKSEFPLRKPYGDQLTIVPMIGLTGAVAAWNLGAAAIARDLAEIYESRMLPLQAPAFFPAQTPLRSVEEITKQVYEYLGDKDSFVLVLTNLRRCLPGSGSLARYPDVEVPGALVEICGIFLDGQGQVLAPRTCKREELRAFVRFDQLKKIASAEGSDDREDRQGEVIVVCGYDDNRNEPLAAAIRAGVVNTLITDEQTSETVRGTLLRPAARVAQYGAG